MSKKRKQKKGKVRNEFHFYLQRATRVSVHKDKSKVIHRKQKYKDGY